MESSGRSLRSRLIVPAQRSPEKAPKDNRKKRAPKNAAKPAGKVKNGGSTIPKQSKSRAAVKEAEEFLEDDSEEEFVQKYGGERSRNKEQEGELLTTAEWHRRTRWRWRLWRGISTPWSLKNAWRR
jgi:hypothetical protein